MTRPSTDTPQWTMVDEAWGRRAVDFATLSEPGNCREYVAVHHRLGVDAGDRLLDVACGSGLAIELGPACAALPVPVSTPRPGWSRWPGTGTPDRHQARRHARSTVAATRSCPCSRCSRSYTASY